jgi:hypothetical protein
MSRPSDGVATRRRRSGVAFPRYPSTRTRCIVLLSGAAVGLAHAGAPASAAEEALGPPKIGHLQAEPNHGESRVRLSAVVAPGDSTTTWRIEVGKFQACGPIKERPRRKRERKKVAEGVITSGTTEVRAGTAYSEYGATRFYVIARDAQGERTGSHKVPQDECHAE